MLLPLIILALSARGGLLPVAAAAMQPNETCLRRCGDIEIPFPFGVGSGCYLETGDITFAMTCNRTDDGQLRVYNYQIGVVDFSLLTGQLRIYSAINEWCYNRTAAAMDKQNNWWYDMSITNYRINDALNRFTVVGCNSLAYIYSPDDSGQQYMTGCMATCPGVGGLENGSCAGVGCCQTAIPRRVNAYTVSFEEKFNTSGADADGFSPCSYAVLAETSEFSFRTAYVATAGEFVRDNKYGSLPLVLDWAIGNKTCEEAKRNASAYACVSANSDCVDSKYGRGSGYLCNCSAGYEGNPYLIDGCQDINECEHPDKYSCHGHCRNKPGSYDCKCSKGSYSADPFKDPCSPRFPLQAQIAIGFIGGLLIMIVLVFITLFRREKRKMKEFFEKNGGPILEKVNNIKLFKKDDLKFILKSGNIIGKGSFGEVYKGHIRETNQLVAVKKPININLSKKDQFANEVIIQSRVIHKNIVKLIGCCLEVDIPILVYEFVSKGSLENILHGNKRVPLNLDQRLHIAAQSAEALAYMHSKTSTTILHGDVKPANILLTDDLLPKISDFGISRLLAMDNDHTMSVIGDMTYMDPVYFQTGLLTDKSDVYSFGVVLLELITRKKASHSDKNNLLRNFLDAYTNKTTIKDFIDEEIAATEHLEILVGIAGMVVQCLSLDVNQRPEMTDIAERLHYMAKKARGI